jgi:prepilin-type N-terminal cleavage/methylation domain-containing protein
MRTLTSCRRPDRPERARRGALARASSRGFTLMEMLAVLAVISVLAAVATPGFVEMIREGRTQREAAMFSDTFRVARSRALGRGSAVAVVMSSADPPTALVYEHVSDDDFVLPLPSCRGTGKWRLVDRVNGRPGASRLILDAPDADGDGVTTHDVVQVCYSPRGRTYVKTGTGGGKGVDVDVTAPIEAEVDDEATGARGFELLTGVVEVSVLRGDGNATNGFTLAEQKARSRKVLVMQNGQTRVSL